MTASPLAQHAAAHVVRRAAARQAAHIAALAAYGLTPESCPVCRICPEVPR